MNYHELQIAGVERKLPLIRVGKTTKIASFSILGDVELCDVIADQMVDKLKDYKFDYLVGPEVKVVPLIHAVAKRLGHKRYFICRKSIKQYMISPIKLDPLPYFPNHIKPLVLNGADADLLRGKKVVIIDDVVSTGVTMRMIGKLMDKLNAKVVTYFAALRQGTQFDEIQNLLYLGELPIFKETSK